MQSSLLATVLCFLCHATWTAAAAPPAIAQISPPPNISPRPTLTSDRLPSPVTVLEEMASFGIDGTRNVVYAEVMLSETLKPADVKNTLRTANATALRKDPRIQLSHFNPFKVKGRGSKVVFKIQRVLERSWTFPDTSHLIDALYKYYEDTEATGLPGRYARIEFIVHDEEGIHLAYGKVRETHTPWAADDVIDGNATTTLTTTALDSEPPSLLANGTDVDFPPPQQSGVGDGGGGGGGGGGEIVKATASLTISLIAPTATVAVS